VTSSDWATVERMSYWCCAQIDQRRERLALYQTYVPRIRGPRKTSLPLFSSYAFILVELQWWQARWAVGVRRLIQNGSAEPTHVPDAVVDGLKLRENRDGLITLPAPPRSGPHFEPGDKVRIKTGPLVGANGYRFRAEAGDANHQLLEKLRLVHREPRFDIAPELRRARLPASNT
jgi:hypothetical protein